MKRTSGRVLSSQLVCRVVEQQKTPIVVELMLLLLLDVELAIS